MTGIDASGDALALAGALLARRGVANVRVVEAHIDAELPDDITAHGSFDVAYTRRFLVHQRDPARTLARIASLLRRGGRIVAHEIPPGSGYPRMTPPEPALERVDALVHTAVGRRGGRPDAALHLAVLCRQAGLRLIEERGFVPAAEPVALLETFQAVLRSIASFVVAEGVTSAGEVTELLSALDKAKPVDRVSAFANLYLEVIAEVP